MFKKYTYEDYKRIHDTKTLTKDDIEHMAREVMTWITQNNKEAWIFFNGKEMGWTWEGSYSSGKYVKFTKEIHHKDFCNWFPDNNIITFSVDGLIYHIFNYGEKPHQKKKLNKILDNYGCELDYMDACYWYVLPKYDGWKIEYTR